MTVKKQEWEYEYFVSYSYFNDKTKLMGGGWRAIIVSRKITDGGLLSDINAFIDEDLQKESGPDTKGVILNYKFLRRFKKRGRKKKCKS